jgi:hypothetical protein
LDEIFFLTSGDGKQRVIVEVPTEFTYQLVFRQTRTEPFKTQAIAGLKFQFIDQVSKGLSAWQNIRSIQSAPSTLKILAKISSGRIFYYITENEEIVHTGWITSSSCRYYNVQSGDIVIGPIWSSESTRGRGIGAWGTKLAMNKLIETGSTVFFIDTSNNNIPCLKLIDRCDFGSPIATYIRREQKET